MADATLAMNPFVDIHVHPQPETTPIDPARIETITVRCPVRGRGVLTRDLTRPGDPALFGFFAALVARGGELELDSDAMLVPALVELGFLVVEDDIVAWPAFSVPLPLPPPPSDPSTPPPGGWIVAAGVLVQPAFALRPGLRWPADYDEQDGRLRCFAAGPALWVGEPDALVEPFWLDADDAPRLAALVPGTPPPSLPPALAARLAQIGALVAADRSLPALPALPALRTLARFTRARADFAADGHAVVRGLLGAAELAALRRYYGALVADNLVPLGGPHHTARFAAYNDPIGRFVHARLTAAMSAIAGQSVEPSFSYLFVYDEAPALAPHRDRAQAEFSISLQIDHTPAPGPGSGPTGWPLRFTFDDGRTAAADLGIGDAVLYHGRAVTHHRDPLAAGQRSTVLVLEYVPLDFQGPRV
ncbi:MAG TPA: hypothetical protein VHW23_20435 [Kofleriaceae bacterium]|jgi:hypothetical protein|nr:hypothetical protein [Kofleriaceae bacterium]